MDRNSSGIMLRVNALSKLYRSQPGQVAGGVREATFDVPQGAFFTLLGPSGCGKTTTLRCVAGLESPDVGSIAIDGETVFDAGNYIETPVNKRNIGMVFQSYAIWPHMTVYENAIFPLKVTRRKRYSRDDIKRRARSALETVGLGGFEARSATQLSGGQQQRLALARAIIHEPALLLLDEPLSNLDVKLREEMRVELKRLQQQVGITAIYVTHDQGEALALSDTIAIMENGNIVQYGTPDEIYHAPANRFVAGFVGTTNFIDGRVAGVLANAKELSVEIADGTLLSCRAPQSPVSVGQAVTICVRPESIRMAATSGEGASANRLSGRISSKTFLGNTTVHYVAVGGHVMQVMSNPDAVHAPNAAVDLHIPSERIVILPKA